MSDLPQTLPVFTPVPRLKDRSNGWKPEVQRAFIEALAETGSVKSAARRVNRASEGAYMLRRQPGAEEFRRAWQAALDFGVQRIEDVAMERALNGVEVPVYSYGKLVGSRTVYNDRLLMFMLRNRAPERFTGGKPAALNAVDQATLKRLKAEWRTEWEQARAMEDAARSRASGDRMLETVKRMHRNWYCCMSPETRAAYRAFRAAEAADDGSWLADDDAEPAAVAEREYEELFGPGRDGRAEAAKLVDIRVWREGPEVEGGEELEAEA